MASYIYRLCLKYPDSTTRRLEMQTILMLIFSIRIILIHYRCLSLSFSGNRTPIDNLVDDYVRAPPSAWISQRSLNICHGNHDTVSHNGNASCCIFWNKRSYCTHILHGSAAVYL